MDTARRASAHTWIGQPVHDMHGEKLGELADVVFDTVDGHMVYGVLSVHGALGIGEKLFAVPWTLLHKETGRENEFRLEASFERLKSAPGFDKDNWPDEADEGFVERTHTAYT